MATKRERTISILPQSKGNVIGVDAVGKVYPEDYEELLRPTFLKAIDEYGSIRLLFRADKFRGWSNPLSLLQDAKTMLRVRRHLDKVATVTSPGWKHLLTRISNPFIQGEARAFNLEDEDKAWQWLAE
jgi:hypothetical protein